MQNSTLSPAPRSTLGWFKASRHPDALALIRHAPLAMIVAHVIAHRAQWRSDFNPHNLAVGEAFLGDFANYGMTRQQYRTALRQLVKWNFATIRATHEGTIAKLTDTRLFAVCDDQPDQRNNQGLTTKQPRPNHYQEHKSIRAEEVFKTVVATDDTGAARREPRQQPKNQQTDEEWLNALKTNPAYAGLDVAREHAKMVAWCSVNGKQPSRRRFVNWLNRAEKPMRVTRATTEEEHLKGF